MIEKHKALAPENSTIKQKDLSPFMKV